MSGKGRMTRAVEEEETLQEDLPNCSWFSLKRRKEKESKNRE